MRFFDKQGKESELFVLIFLLIITLLAAVCVTVCTVIKQKEKNRKMPIKTKPMVWYAEEEVPPPANGAVLYEGSRDKMVRRCADCGCEYPHSVTVCEICGKRL